ncbi:transcriptional regulator WhiJ [Actinocorallia lasiicapitis]
MQGDPQSSARRRHIARYLYELRISKNITLVTAGRLLDRSASSLSMIENARQPLRPRDLQQILYAYGAEMTSPDVRSLLELARQDIHKGWWIEFADLVSPSALDSCSLEFRADRIRQISMGGVCGLLQTEDYARAIINNPLRHTGEPDLERYVQFRMARKAIFDRSDELEFHAILSEAVLRSGIGDRKTMQVQLRRLLDAADDPRITIQIYPFASEFALGASHSLIRLARSNLSVLLLEQLFDRQFIEDSAQIHRYDETFALVAGSVLTPAASADLILGILSDL